MSWKKWALLVLCALLIWGGIKLFYKTYSINAVAKDADYIIALDIKRITNTVIWNVITTPSQWKAPSFSKSSKEISWQDMVAIPDYVFAFHAKGQPTNIGYVVLDIKNEIDFEKGLQQYHFEKIDNNQYYNNNAGIQIFKQGSKILVSNASLENKNYVAQIADELFIQKKYITKETLDKVVAAKSHLAIYIASNNFLQKDAIATANFDKQKIVINATLTPNTVYHFAENNFSYSDTSLCTLGFTQPTKSVYTFIGDTTKNNISKAINLNIDSLFFPSNKYYSLNLTNIKTRVDSAVTYEYDDNFNKVEKKTVNTIQEPAFEFLIVGDSVNNIYNQWISNKKNTQADTGKLFTAMPFVKSYCSLKNENELAITASNYLLQAGNNNIGCICFFNLSITKIPKNLFKYLPDDVAKLISNIEAAHLVLNKQNELLNLHILIQKRDNDLPIINW